MRLLYVAEPVGKPGLFALRHTFQELCAEFRPDFVWGNGDGATGGFGLGKNHAFTLHKLGLRSIVLGECAYYKKDLHPSLATMPFVLRPCNYPVGSPGKGYHVYSAGRHKVGVISVMGQSGWSRPPATSPYVSLGPVIEEIRRETRHVLVDCHANTSAEKQTLFHWLDGRVSAVIGSHQKVQTDDARVLPRGTATMTDAGRTGSKQSVQGFLPSREIERLMTGLPLRSEPAWNDLVVQGVFVETDETGSARSIESFERQCKEVPHESSGNHHED